MSFSYKTVLRALPADAHTPVSVYLKVRDIFPCSLLLESSDYHRKEHGYSYICCQPDAGIEAYGATLRRTLPGGDTQEEQMEPNKIAEAVSSFIPSFTFSETQPACCSGRFFGHFNYDAVRYFEQISLADNIASPDHPDIRLHIYRFMIVFDHHHHTMYLVEHYTDARDIAGMEQLEAALRNNHPGTFTFNTVAEEQSGVDDATFLAMAEQGRAHCLRGDVFQIVLSRDFSTRFKGDDFNLYRALRMVNPSPYLFYFDFGNYRLLGSSPEAQVKRKKGQTIIHPIAGTCRHTGEADEDALLVKALQADPKENAEHTMLVDLARNDLSKSHDIVEVAVYKELQQFSHVTHLVSEVCGRAPLHNDPIRILAETFPAGTLSGAPKYRAMQLIDTYEPNSRGYYGGCIGYIKPDGDMDMAIMIRSFRSCDHTLYYQAGAGIVASSVAENELQEISHKLKGLRKAIELAATL